MKKPRSSHSAQVSQKTPSDSPNPAGPVNWDQLDPRERVSVICTKFSEGLKFSEIADQINAEYYTCVSRESIYPIVLQAVKKGWIRYTPPQEVTLELRLKDHYPWLMDTRVAHTAQFKEVAYYGAKTLIDLLKQMHHQKKNEVHIGFAGGHAMRMVATQFAEMIRASEGNIPRKLTLHALVAGFDVFEPTTDPNTFFTLFQSDKLSGIDFQFVGLHTPPVVKTKDYQELTHVQGIKESYDKAIEIDIIVTSATNWDDSHSTFNKYMTKSPNCHQLLEEQKCVGDMLWMPLGRDNLIEAHTDIRAMTLMELNQLPEFINQGKYVLLVLGPCAICNQTKSKILKAILEQKQRLITHLVADSRSVRELWDYTARS